jgi:hypothetical protein
MIEEYNETIAAFICLLAICILATISGSGDQINLAVTTGILGYMKGKTEQK